MKTSSREVLTTTSLTVQTSANSSLDLPYCCWSTDLELLTVQLTTAPTLGRYLSTSDFHHLSSLGCLDLST
ncbi:hypothetical protein J6590_028761 [Homalodisca vitripennis]|nr:hypothetical protein J6590_028761 [Homalodisca vitripennis]